MLTYCDYFNIQGCFWHSDIWLQYGVQSQAFFFVYPNSCALPFPSLNAWNSLGPVQTPLHSCAEPTGN